MATTNYISVDGAIFGEFTGSAVRNYGTDALSSVVDTTINGVAENTYRYTPYGAILAQSGIASDPMFLWKGGQAYQYTGLAGLPYCLSSRLYSSQTLIWSTANPFGPYSSAYGIDAGSPVTGSRISLSSPALGSGGGSSTPFGFISCYRDQGCASCHSVGLTPVSVKSCTAPYCCNRSIYYTDKDKPYAAMKAKPLVKVFNCLDIVTISTFHWDKYNKKWVATGKTASATIVDTGRLTPAKTHDDTEQARDGNSYERLVDVYPGVADSLGKTGKCDDWLRIGTVKKTGNAFPDGKVCWSNKCTTVRTNKQQSECATIPTVLQVVQCQVSVVSS